MYVDKGKFGWNTGNIFTNRFQQIKSHIYSFKYTQWNESKTLCKQFLSKKKFKKWISKVPQERINFRHANNTYMYYYECITSL